MVVFLFKKNQFYDLLFICNMLKCYHISLGDSEEMDTEVKNKDEELEKAETTENTEAAKEKKETEKGKKEKKNKKKSPKKKKENFTRDPEQAKTKSLLTAILAVGICLLAVSIIGMISVSNGMNKAAVQTTTNAAVGNQQNNAVNNNPQQNTPDANQQQNNSNQPQNTQISADNNPVQSGNAPQTDAEWLTFFNNAVNKLKSGEASFTKAKRTATTDIQLSNGLAQSYVSVVKDKFLSDETVKTDIAKGDTASAVKNVSPDGANYVSSLTVGDIKSMTHSANSNGNYVVRIDMNDMTNPEKSGPYGKIFEFMVVDDVVNTYAPNIGATVDRANISLVFKNCYAEAEITPDGKVVKYSTYVNANMILKDAKIKVVTTDLDAALASDTVYDNIVW